MQHYIDFASKRAMELGYRYRVAHRKGVPMVIRTVERFGRPCDRELELGRHVKSFQVEEVDERAIKRMIRNIRRERPELKGRRLGYVVDSDPLQGPVRFDSVLPRTANPQKCLVYIPLTLKDEVARFKAD